MKQIGLRRLRASLILIGLCCSALLLTGSGIPESEQPALRDCPVMCEEEFGGVFIEKTIDEFNALGFAYGDSVNIEFSNGYEMKGVPYYSGYYTYTGMPLLVAYPGYPYISAGFYNGESLWELAELEEGDTATVTLAEAGTFLEVQNARDIHYSNDREDYPDDETFANFREARVGDLKENTLYRSASPCDNKYMRAPYVDKLIAAAGVNTIINLADSGEKIEGYIREEGFDSPYFLSLYERGSVFPLAMNTNFDSDAFQEKMRRGLEAIIENDGPYLVHCTLGKDRTGFVCMLLEALCGASYQEIKDDYMITYSNYYQITPEREKVKYDTIIRDVFNPMVQSIIPGDETADPESVDLTACAEAFIKKIGLDETQIEALRQRLCG